MESKSVLGPQHVRSGSGCRGKFTLALACFFEQEFLEELAADATIFGVQPIVFCKTWPFRRRLTMLCKMFCLCSCQGKIAHFQQTSYIASFLSAVICNACRLTNSALSTSGNI